MRGPPAGLHLMIGSNVRRCERYLIRTRCVLQGIPPAPVAFNLWLMDLFGVPVILHHALPEGLPAAGHCRMTGEKA